MSTLSAEQRTARAKLASLSALATQDPSLELEVAHARRDFHALKLEANAREAVSGWPPLTSEQAARLIAILRPAAGDLSG